jgi:hypothetical protein
MTTDRILQLLPIAATCLLFTSRIHSSVPLSDPLTSKTDERLAGGLAASERRRFGEQLPLYPCW